MSNHNNNNQADDTMLVHQAVKVAIVGAGAAGLRCAHTLITDYGLDPTELVILEARNRIGGRIHTTTMHHHHDDDDDDTAFSYDHGAAWVHGTGSAEWGMPLSDLQSTSKPQVNPMMELLEQETMDYGTNNENIYERHLNPVAVRGNPWMRPRTVLHHGEDLPTNAALGLYVAGKRLDDNNETDKTIIRTALDSHVELMKQVHRIGNAMFDNGEGMQTITTSLADALELARATTRRTKANDNDDESTTQIAQALTPFYLHLLECWYGASASDLQLCEFSGGDDDDAVGDDSRYQEEGDFDGPHCTLKRGMASVLQPLLHDGVRDRIRLQQQVTSIVQQQDDDDEETTNNIILRTASGLKVQAKACVVTLPAGCLKEKIQQQEKAFFEPALSDEKRRAVALTKMGSYKKVLLTFDRIFWPVDPFFLGMIRKVDTTSNNTDDEDNNPLGNYLLFDNLWAIKGVPMLEAVLYGSSGEWATHQSDEVIRDAVLDFMRDAMGDHLMSEDDNELMDLHSSCQSCHVTRWEEDPFSRGAYSSMALGATELHTEELRRPEWDGHLIFAGEATISEFEGSVHAALFSGTSAAEKAHASLMAARRAEALA